MYRALVLLSLNELPAWWNIYTITLLITLHKLILHFNTKRFSLFRFKKSRSFLSNVCVKSENFRSDFRARPRCVIFVLALPLLLQININISLCGLEHLCNVLKISYTIYDSLTSDVYSIISLLLSICLDMWCE